jgi:hypothetical protein
LPLPTKPPWNGSHRRRHAVIHWTSVPVDGVIIGRCRRCRFRNTLKPTNRKKLRKPKSQRGGSKKEKPLKIKEQTEERSRTANSTAANTNRRAWSVSALKDWQEEKGCGRVSGVQATAVSY